MRHPWIYGGARTRTKRIDTTRLTLVSNRSFTHNTHHHHCASKSLWPRGHGNGGRSLHQSFLTLAWPSGEFGAMGLEGAVKLGFKKELESYANESEKNQRYAELVSQEYEKGKGSQCG